MQKMNIFYLFYLASTPFSGYNKKQKLTDSEVSGMGRNATLKDVAEKVGLSVASVSLVLNQKPNRISLESQERIFAAAEQLGYKPKFRQPRRPLQKPITLGLILPEISNSFFADIVQGVDDCIRHHGAQFMLATNGESAQRDAEQIRQFVSAGISALLIAPSYNCHPSVFEGVPFPVIQVDRQSPSLPFSSIRLNNKKGGYLATRQLIELGRRHIICITGPNWLLSSQEREEGFRWAMNEAGISVTPDMILEGDYQTESGYRLAPQLLSKGASAVFCENDMMALGVYRYFREHGINVGSDISLVGFDDISFCEFMETPLTTVRQSGYDIGNEACKRAFLEIEHPDLPKQTIYFEPELIIRKSSEKYGGAQV